MSEFFEHIRYLEDTLENRKHIKEFIYGTVFHYEFIHGYIHVNINYETPSETIDNDFLLKGKPPLTTISQLRYEIRKTRMPLLTYGLIYKQEYEVEDLLLKIGFISCDINTFKFETEYLTYIFIFLDNNFSDLYCDEYDDWSYSYSNDLDIQYDLLFSMFKDVIRNNKIKKIFL